MAQDQSGFKWRTAAALPIAVQEIYPTLHNREIWLSGGIVGQAGKVIGPTAETFIFSRHSNEWRAGPALPKPLHHPHLESHNGDLFCIGGFAVFSLEAAWVMQSACWRLSADGWRPIQAAPAPIGEAVTASFGGRIHVCGGRRPKGDENAALNDHIDVATHYVFDGDRWDEAAPLPMAKNSAAAELIKGNWHVVGGRCVNGGNSSTHHVYDPKADRWREAAPLPQGRSGLASGVLDGKLCVFGGESLSNVREVYGDCWVYDPKVDAWRDGPRMLTPRHGLGGVAYDGVVYAIGGAEQPSGEGTTNCVEALYSAT